MAGPYSTSINWDMLNSMTERTWLPGVADTIFGGNQLYDKLWKDRVMKNGGESIMARVLYGEGPGGAYSGTRPLDLSKADIVTAARYQWKQYYAGAEIDWIEELKNGGEAEMGSILAVRLDTMEQTLQNLLGQGIQGDGSDPETVTGLAALVSNVVAVTVGGISASTNPWWQNTIVNMTGVPLSVFKMRQTRGLITHGRKSSNFVVTTQVIHDLWYALAQPAQRFVDTTARTLMADVGFEELPVVVDEHVPPGFLYHLNTDDLQLVVHSRDSFKLWGWMGIHDQMFKTNKLTITLNLVCRNRRYQAVMYGITQ